MCLGAIAASSIHDGKWKSAEAAVAGLSCNDGRGLVEAIQDVAFLHSQLPGIDTWVQNWMASVGDYVAEAVAKFKEGRWAGSAQTLQNLVMELTMCNPESVKFHELEVQMGEELSKKSSVQKWSDLLKAMESLERAMAEGGDFSAVLSSTLTATTKCQGLPPGDEAMNQLSLTWVFLRDRQVSLLSSGAELGVDELELMSKWSLWMSQVERTNLGMIQEISNVKQELLKYEAGKTKLDDIMKEQGEAYLPAPLKSLLQRMKSAESVADSGARAMKELQTLLSNTVGQVASRVMEAEKKLLIESQASLSDLTTKPT